MINIDDLINIGQFAKPHGVKGEISLISRYDTMELFCDACLICVIDSIPVPFFVDSCRYKTDTVMLVKLSGLDTGESVKQLSGCNVYVSKDVFDPSDIIDNEWSSIVGYRIIDSDNGLTGKIVDINDSTMNILLLVENEGDEFMIPAALISGIKHEDRTVDVVLPEGYFDII
jgi:16S rRNA processing protein RimM